MGKTAYYKGLILREFYFAKTLSCADLSERIGKSLPLTMKMLTELIADGLVRESGFAPSSGGRRPLMYSIEPDTTYTVAIAMDQLVSRIGVMDVNNKLLAPIVEFELPLLKNPAAMALLAGKIDEVIANSGISKEKIIGAGVGMPGFVDSEKGLNHSYQFFDTGNKSIPAYLSEKLGIPVYIDNDSSLIALAEFRFGAARNKKNAMVVNIGWGIGLGMVINGDLFRGENGFAGEFSHIPMFSNNKLCDCGKSGCLETEASLLVVVEKAKEGLHAGRSSNLGNGFPSGHFEKDCEAVILAATKGDRFAVELLSESAYNIGRGIAILIHLVNPESIILSGRGALAGKIWLAPIQHALNEHCIPRLAASTTVETSTLGHQAELIGAAALVMEKMVNGNMKQMRKQYALMNND